jgi:hypothetical protein
VAADALPGPAQWLPSGAVFTVQVEQPTQLIDLASDLKLLDFATSGDKGLRNLLAVLSKSLGTDTKGVIGKLTGRGITYAVYPGESPVWLFDAPDASALDVIQQVVKLAAGAHPTLPASTPPKPGPFYQEYPGDVAAWSLDGKQFFARTGNRLVLTNNPETLKALFSPRTAGVLDSAPNYQKARQAAGPNVAAWAFVNMAVLNRYPPTQKALESGSDVINLLLAGAVKQSLRSSEWLALGLRIDGKKLQFHAAVDALMVPSGEGGFTQASETGVLPNLAVPRELGAATLWRDLGKFYADKETFFPEKTSAGILAENFFEIFFTGRDLREEVFRKFQPQIRFVVAAQQYDPKIGTPIVQFPAVALVFRVNQPDEFSEVFEEAWQKAIGLNNFTRGQQALPGLIIDRQTYAGVPFTYAYFSSRTETDRAHLPVRFNLRPALAHTGPYLILSTTDGLTRDLIDAVNREDGVKLPASRAGSHSIIEINGVEGIAALLNANKAELIRANVLAKGQKLEDATKEVEQNLAWLNKLKRADLSFYSTSAGHQADLDLELK